MDTAGGRIQIKVPQVRKSPKPYHSKLVDLLRMNSDVLECLALEMYTRGLYIRDIEEEFQDATGDMLLSRSAVSAITDQLWEDYQAFSERDLSVFKNEFLFLDGIDESLHRLFWLRRFCVVPARLNGIHTINLQDVLVIWVRGFRSNAGASEREKYLKESRRMNANQEHGASLPLRFDLTLIYILSFVIAILMAVASIAGLLYQTVIYPTDELLQSFLPTDVTLLFIGLPMLLGSIWLTWRGKLIGLLLWPGTLFFVLYNYIVYVFAMPLNAAFLLHLAMVMLSVYALIGLVASMDGEEIKQRLTDAVPERLSGGILAGLGFLFFLRVIVVLVNALIHQTPIPELELTLNASDFILSPAWIVCGILLWRRKAFGYVTGLGLLFQASMLFVGLIIVLLVQPSLTNQPFALVDVVVVFIMGLICFIPFGLFMRGVANKHKSSSV